MRKFKYIFLGRPLKNTELQREKLTRIWGLPIMASDAVSSVAYAGEEILLVLVPAVALGAFHFVPWVTLPIILLLLFLIISYSQIIDHYPNGGGAYIVSRENLGKYPSLVAAGSLIINYILTVAVSIASATAAIASAFPELLGYKVQVALLLIVLITFGNLRGVRESSRIFGLPTYIFIFSMLIMVVIGLYRFSTGSLHALTYTAQQLAELKSATEGIGIALLLRAFASGCSALTGVEAVSNAIPSFKEPSQRNAKHVLYLLGLTIFLVFGGTTLLEVKLQAIPAAGITVTSQIAVAVFGQTFMFYVIQIFTALILMLGANTAYNGLPLLLYILAHDNFVPRQFSHRGTKLSFSNGIMFILICSSLLIIQTGSDVHRLIPLYAIGVFISFTLSQYGMFKKWHKTRDRGWQYKMWINGAGSAITLIVTLVIFVSRFAEGAWMFAVILPVMIMMMLHVNKHYNLVKSQLELKEFYPFYRNREVGRNQCIVLVQEINKSLLKSLNYANSISKNVVALHICRHPEHAKELRTKWEKLNIPIKLEVILTSYRDIITPLDEYISEREAKLDHGDNLSVIIIKYVSEHWYDVILHNQTTYFLERVLSRHKNVSSVILPFRYIDHAKPPPEAWAELKNNQE
jgi:amino acid transporter